MSQYVYSVKPKDSFLSGLPARDACEPLLGGIASIKTPMPTWSQDGRTTERNPSLQELTFLTASRTKGSELLGRFVFFFFFPAK